MAASCTDRLIYLLKSCAMIAAGNDDYVDDHD